MFLSSFSSAITFLNLFSCESLLLKTTILVAVAFAAYHYYQWRKLCSIIDRIPGPPVHPVIPWIGHACIVLDLDRCKFPYGTYVRK
jgi:hypothetical protein